MDKNVTEKHLESLEVPDSNIGASQTSAPYSLHLTGPQAFLYNIVICKGFFIISSWDKHNEALILQACLNNTVLYEPLSHYIAKKWLLTVFVHSPRDSGAMPAYP